MKNTVYQGLAFLAMMLSLAACQKSGPASNETGENGASVSKKRISITATIPETITKVAMTQEDNGSGKPTGPVSLAWETGDEITISNGTDTEVFKLKSVEGTKAVFEGNEITGSSFTITYSKLPDFKRQTQPVNASTEDLGWEGKLSGVNAITDFTFSSDWATAHGGTFTQSSILRLRAKLPEGVAPTIDCVTIKAFDTVTGEKVNLINDNIPQIAVAIKSTGTEAETDVVTVYATMPAEDITIPKGKALLFSFSSTNSTHSVYTHYRPITTSPITIAQGTVTPLDINCPNVATYAGVSDDGTQSKPYLIGDKYQLKAMSGRLETTKTYFKLVDDIDMTDEAWTSLNSELDTQEQYVVVFDGNGKEISHLGNPFFYYLNGEVVNLTIKDSEIDGGNKISGILARVVKSSNCKVENVDVVGTSAGSSYIKATAYSGGLIGQIDGAATVTGCDIVNTNVTGTLAGGVVGYANAIVTMNACTYAGGSVEASARYCGGMLGSTGNFASIISDCHVTNATITSSADRVGGFVGQLQTKVQIKGCTVGTETQKVNVSSTLSGATANLGGFAGVCYGTVTKNGEVRSKAYVTVNCSNTTTSGTQINIGGFTGYHTGKIEYSDAVVSMTGLKGEAIGGFCGVILGNGNVTDCSQQGNVTGNNYTGGFAGLVTQGLFTNCYATGEVSGQQSVGGFAGKSIAGTYSNCSYQGTKVTGSQSSGNGFLGGFCGNTEPTETQNNKFTSCYVYNANGTVITGSTQRVAGFIGQLGGNKGYDASESISECYVKNVSVSGTGNHYGGFCGVQYGPIEKSFVDGGTVTAGGDNVGGFSGYQEKAALTNCYSTATVVGGSRANIGGITGQLRNQNTSTITNCYYAGTLTGTGTKGGIVGLAAGTNCTITGCISWDSSLAICGSSGTLSNNYVKAASETGTVSSHAQESPRGWSDTIWSFNGDFPTLIDVN